MTPVHRSLARFGAVAALLIVHGTVAAQNQYAEQVQNYLDQVADRLLDDSYSLEGESSGWMMDGSQNGTIVQLPAGSYTAFGACDDDCTDIDMVVTRMDTQENLDDDREDDSFPIVRFTLSAETSVLIAMSMPTCGTARCYAGFRWYSNGSASTSSDADAGTWEGQVMTQLQALPTSDGVSVVDERTGLVDASGSTRFSLNLSPGHYGAVAVCDNDCSNVDLLVYDAGGSQVASDVLDDDVPIVDFEVRKGGGTYYFEVKMVSCTTSSCGFGFRLMQGGM